MGTESKLRMGRNLEIEDTPEFKEKLLADLLMQRYDPRAIGDLYFNHSNGKIYIYTGVDWVETADAL